MDGVGGRKSCTYRSFRSDHDDRPRFQVFLADEHIHAVLSNLQRHLVSKGQLAFDSRNPLVREWSEWTPDQTLEQVEVPGIGEVIVYYDVCSAVDQFVTFETHFTFPSQEKVITTSTLRFMPQDKIARSLSAAGFTNLQWYGDYKGGRLSPMSPEIIAIAS